MIELIQYWVAGTRRKWLNSNRHLNQTQNYEIPSMSTEELKNEIVSSVGYDPKCAPMQLNEAETAQALGVKASTLSVWRSTGRYDLRYVKAGRLVRYRVSDIAEFIERRTVFHT
jgi:hypothetical protein